MKTTASRSQPPAASGHMASCVGWKKTGMAPIARQSCVAGTRLGQSPVGMRQKVALA
jgi:hypothetical protein